MGKAKKVVRGEEEGDEEDVPTPRKAEPKKQKATKKVEGEDDDENPPPKPKEAETKKGIPNHY